MAPAKEILSTVYTGRDWITTSPVCGDGPVVDGYGLCTGTSMSAPFVSGIAGLLRSANPLLSGWEIHRLLMENAESQHILGCQVGYGCAQCLLSGRQGNGYLRGTGLGQPADSSLQPVQRDGHGLSLHDLSSSRDSRSFRPVGRSLPAEIENLVIPAVSTPYSPVGPAVPGYLSVPWFHLRDSSSFDLRLHESDFTIPGAPPWSPCTG